jgi:uncharacterized membrane protein HdeD (DUF308 family)
VAAVRLRKVIDDEWLLGLSGAASILFGVLIFTHPTKGMYVIAIMIGAYMVALGMMAIGLSLRLRQLQRGLVISAAGAGAM